MGSRRWGLIVDHSLWMRLWRIHLALSSSSPVLPRYSRGSSFLPQHPDSLCMGPEAAEPSAHGLKPPETWVATDLLFCHAFTSGFLSHWQKLKMLHPMALISVVPTGLFLSFISFPLDLSLRSTGNIWLGARPCGWQCVKALAGAAFLKAVLFPNPFRMFTVAADGFHAGKGSLYPNLVSATWRPDLWSPL